MKKLLLNLETPPPRHQNNKPLLLKDILRLSTHHEIKQHQCRNHFSPDKAIINQIKLKLNENTPKQVKSQAVDGWMKGTIDKKQLWSVQGRRPDRMTAMTKTKQKRKDEFSITSNDFVKRYLQELEQEEKNIEVAISSNRFRYRSIAISRQGRPRKRCDNPEPSSTVRQRKNTLQLEHQHILENLSPYKRVILSRRHTKGDVEPWSTVGG